MAKFKIRRLISILVMLLVVSLVVTGCSGSGQQASSGSSTSSSGQSSSSSSGSSGQQSSEPIKFGLLEDRSGDFALCGAYKTHAAQLAIDEINAAGGLLGRKIELIAPDTQSDNQKYQEMARKLILQDKVDVIMGGFSSASREAIRPIMEEHKMLYFYNNQYEGGVASHYTFCIGAIPEHQVEPLIKYMVDNYGKRCYTIAADYNFGQITADWVEKAVKENGGEIVGEEFLPLSVSQFSSSIEKIQNAKPDFLVVLLTGVTQSSFYGQWAKAGLNIPMATTINIAQGYEHKRFDPPALANMYVTAQYIEELDTPEAQEFTKKYREKFPDDPYIGMEAEATYVGINLWAEAVRRAGTTEVEAVIKELENNLSFDGPAGKVTIDPKTHHTIRDIWIIHCDEKHNITFKQKFEQIIPYWLSDVKGIDLTKSSPNAQYTPLD